MTFSSILSPELASAFVVAPALKVGDLVVYTMPFNGQTMGARIIRDITADWAAQGVVLADQQYNVRVLDGPYKGDTYPVNAKDVAGAV